MGQTTALNHRAVLSNTWGSLNPFSTTHCWFSSSLASSCAGSGHVLCGRPRHSSLKELSPWWLCCFLKHDYCSYLPLQLVRRLARDATQVFLAAIHTPLLPSVWQQPNLLLRTRVNCPARMMMMPFSACWTLVIRGPKCDYSLKFNGFLQWSWWKYFCSWNQNP